MNPLRQLRSVGVVERNLADLVELVGVTGVAERLVVDVDVVRQWVFTRLVPPQLGGRIWAALFHAKKAEQDGPSFRHNGRWKLYVEARRAGVGVTEIARRFGVAHQVVSRALRAQEVRDGS